MVNTVISEENPIKPQSTAFELMKWSYDKVATLFHEPKMTWIVRSRALDEPIVLTNETDPNEPIKALKRLCGDRRAPLIKVS